MIEKARERGQRDGAVENSRFRGQFELNQRAQAALAVKVSGKKNGTKEKTSGIQIPGIQIQ